jgi:hypothetical protein
VICYEAFGEMIEPHNKRMQTDLTSHYASCEAADARRYVLIQVLHLVSIMLLFINEWHSKDLEGNEIKSQRD